MSAPRDTDLTATDPTPTPTDAPGRSGRSFLRRPLALTAAAMTIALTATGAVAATAHKTVELDVNGEVRTVSTFAGTVDGALAQAGVDVAPRDAVTPAGDATISDGSEIVVRHARSLDVNVAGQTQTMWTTAPTATEALSDLQAAGRNATVVTSRSSGRVELAMPLVPAGSVTVLVDGQEIAVTVDDGAHVEDVLALAGTTLGDLDRAVLSVNEVGAPVVTVSRVVRGERVDVETIEHGVREQSDGSLYEDQRRVVRPGVDGAVERTYRTLTVDGQETQAVLTGETVTAEPVEEIIAVGTKERPAAPAATSSGAGSYVGSGVWGALAQCESGGNPTIVSASGTYHGLYQFSVATWRSVGGSGLPSQASPAEQTQRAQMLQARSGWGQWPHCAAKLGLL